MKSKKTIKKLTLSKEIISSIDKKNISGGVMQPIDDVGLWSIDKCNTLQGRCTIGCTDGCGTRETFQTLLNCTLGDFTRDC